MMKIRGKPEDGLGKGKIFVSMPGYMKALRDACGFFPYPGTLNIRVSADDSKNIHDSPGWKRVQGFSANGRTYGDVLLLPCLVLGEKSFIIRPLKSGHEKEVVELIAGKRLRELADDTELEIDI
jgi:riboflavin kinase